MTTFDRVLPNNILEKYRRKELIPPYNFTEGEYYLAGDKQKAETLLRQLGHKDKHIKKFLKKVEEISHTEEMEEVSEVLKGRIAKKYLN